MRLHCPLKQRATRAPSPARRPGRRGKFGCTEAKA